MRFTYLGPADHMWPDLAIFDEDGVKVASVPVVGESYEWGDRVPSEWSWQSEAETAKGLADHTKPQLVELAAGEGLELKVSQSKDELVAAIEEHRRVNSHATDDGQSDDEQTDDENDDGDQSGDADTTTDDDKD